MMFIKDYSFSEWIIENYSSLADDDVDRHMNGKFFDYADRVIKFENLEDEFRTLLKEYDIPYAGKIPIVNKTDGKPCSYRDYYTDEAKNIVERFIF